MNRNIFIITLLSVAIAQAAIISVDDDGIADFNGIQAAIEYAEQGDVIIVQPGVYKEDINFSGKDVVLMSSNPSDPNIVQQTIIESLQSDEPGFHGITFQGGETPDCIITGFNCKCCSISVY